jgi:3-oxoacyl-[acyl-carrier-protein] synthase II
MPGWLAGQVEDTSPPPGTASMERVSQLAVEAADEAVGSAGFDPHRFAGCLGHNVGISIGTSKGSILALAQLADSARTANPGHIKSQRQGSSPWEALAPDAPARAVARRYQAGGAVHCTVAACATGVLSVIQAANWIREGACSIALAGSTDAALAPLWFGAFERMGVLATAHPQRGPAWACRPFDRTRSGFAIGEGAAVLVLESAQSIRQRRFTPLARLSGWAVGTDPVSLIRSTDDGTLLARLIEQACRIARVDPTKLAAVHAHGTATITNDLLETRALRAVLGSHVGDVPVVSIKGAVGHLLGAAGAVELALAAKTCMYRKSPGNITLLDVDPSMADLQLPRAAFPLASGVILKTSLGFGGHQAAVVIAP